MSLPCMFNKSKSKCWYIATHKLIFFHITHPSVAVIKRSFVFCSTWFYLFHALPNQLCTVESPQIQIISVRSEVVEILSVGFPPEMLTGWPVSTRPGQPVTRPAGYGSGWTSDGLRAHGLVIWRVYGFAGRVYTLTCNIRVSPRVTNFVFHTTYTCIHFSFYSFDPPLF